MIKRSNDEPDDKALERLKEFEQKRMPVTGDEKEEEKDEKKLPKNSDEKKKGKHDKATDQL